MITSTFNYLRVHLQTTWYIVITESLSLRQIHHYQTAFI